MKSFKIILCILLLQLVFSGCGGGGGGSAGVGMLSEDSGFIEKPASESEALAKADIYHQKVAKDFINSNNHILRSDGLIDIAAEMKITPIDSSKIVSLTKRYDEEITTLSKINAKLLIDTLNLQILDSKSRKFKLIRNRSKSRFFVAPIILKGIGLGLSAYVAYKIYKKSNDATIKNARNNILNVAGTDDNGRKRIVLLMITHGIDINRDASVIQINKKIDDISTNNLTSISRDGLSFASKDPLTYGDALIASKKDVVELAVTLGEVAVEGTIAGATAGTGSIGSTITNKTVGTGVDVITTVTSTDPISIVQSHVSTTLTTEEKETIVVEKTDMTLKDAKRIIVKIAKDGPGEIKVKDIEDSQRAILCDIAKNDGDGDDGTLGVPRYATTQSYNLTDEEKKSQSDPYKKSGILKVYDEYSMDKSVIYITNGKEINHMITDFTPILDGEATIELKVNKPTIKLSSRKITFDETSITYSVTAKLTGVKEKTTVTISLSNASTSSSTKTIGKDGSVSWIVIVLKDDATINVIRSDNGAKDTIYLKGVGEDTVPDKYFVLERYSDGICCFPNREGGECFTDYSLDGKKNVIVNTDYFEIIDDNTALRLVEGPEYRYKYTGTISKEILDMTAMTGSPEYAWSATEYTTYKGDLSSGIATIVKTYPDDGYDDLTCTSVYKGRKPTQEEYKTYQTWE